MDTAELLVVDCEIEPQVGANDEEREWAVYYRSMSLDDPRAVGARARPPHVPVAIHACGALRTYSRSTHASAFCLLGVGWGLGWG